MAVRVISIAPDYTRILCFLYPTYSWTTSNFVTSRFILRKDINTKGEREMADYYYSDAVIISSRIFDELWDENKIKEEAIAFMRRTFKSRRKVIPTLATEGPDFLDEVIRFMFTEQSVAEDESTIMELFNRFGSSTFATEYFKLCDQLSVPQVRAAMFTFLSKLVSDTDSIFYKKKQQVYLAKVKQNYPKAYQAYTLRDKDPQGLSFLKFLMDLTA